MIKGFFKSLKNTIISPQEEKQIIIESVKTVTGKIIQRKYAKEKVLGSGAFAQCFVTRNLQTNKLFATKVISKDNRNRIKLLNQLLVHQQLHHPNIVEFSHAFEDKFDIYVFLELCPNNSLEHIMIKKGLLNKWEIKKFLYQIIQAMIYIHSKNVIHRDIKPRNIFLGNNNEIKVGDFGLATKLDFEGQRKRAICGTPQYMPPQMIEGCGYGKQADIWAVGILLYQMHTGVTPFHDTTNQKITDNICNINFEYSQKGISKQAMNLIRRMLIRNPQLRPSWQDILESSFFNDQIGKQISSTKTPRGSTFHINFESVSSTYTPRSSVKAEDKTEWGSKTATSKNSQSGGFFDKKFSKSSTNGFGKNDFSQEKKMTDYVVQTYEIGNDFIAYKMSNHSVGVLKKDTEVLHEFVHLKYIQLAKNGKNKFVEDLSKIDPKLKVILQNSKRKFQIAKPVCGSSKDEFVYLTKFSKNKNIQMLILSNNILQIRFSDKTDVLIEIMNPRQNAKVISKEEIFEIKAQDILTEKKQECKLAHLDSQQVSYVKKLLISLGMNESNNQTAHHSTQDAQNPEVVKINKMSTEKESFGLRENVRTV